MKSTCKHCDRQKEIVRNALCNTCYKRHRSSYRMDYRNTGNRGAFLGNVVPPQATRAMPGTPEKFAVLEARAAAGFQLWHPGDARDNDLRPGWQMQAAYG